MVEISDNSIIQDEYRFRREEQARAQAEADNSKHNESNSSKPETKPSADNTNSSEQNMLSFSLITGKSGEHTGYKLSGFDFDGDGVKDTIVTDKEGKFKHDDKGNSLSASDNFTESNPALKSWQRGLAESKDKINYLRTTGSDEAADPAASIDKADKIKDLLTKPELGVSESTSQVSTTQKPGSETVHQPPGQTQEATSPESVAVRKGFASGKSLSLDKMSGPLNTNDPAIRSQLEALGLTDA